MDLHRDLAEIGHLTDAQVGRISELVADENQRVHSPAELTDLVRQRIGPGSADSDRDVAAVLVGQLLQLHQLARRLDRSASDLLDTHRSRLATELDRGEDEPLRRGLDILERLLSVKAFSFAAQAIDLAYDCDNLLQRSRVLTDVRPMFSPDASSICGAIVAHTLRLSFDHAGRDDEIQFSLDAADLRQLILQCERALLKEQTARRDLIDRAGIPATRTTTPVTVSIDD